MSPPRSGWLPDTPDDQLVLAAQRGDRAALDALLRRHHDRILVLCRRLCHDRGEAEDATQNALIAIVRGLPHFDRTAAFTTWSYRVATNACFDELRRRGRRPEPTDPSTAEVRGDDRTAPLLHRGHSADPEQAAIDTDRRGELQRALDRLPDEFRVPVVLRDVADLDYAEIAELLGLAPGTVRSRISRGRSKLAAMLQLVTDPDRSDGAGPGEGNQTHRPDVTAQDAP